MWQTDRQTDRRTTDKVIPKWRSAMLAPQKQPCDNTKTLLTLWLQQDCETTRVSWSTYSQPNDMVKQVYGRRCFSIMTKDQRIIRKRSVPIENMFSVKNWKRMNRGISKRKTKNLQVWTNVGSYKYFYPNNCTYNAFSTFSYTDSTVCPFSILFQFDS